MRFTRRDEGPSAAAGAAPPVALAGADLRLAPGAADAPIPADFNLPEAFFAGAVLPGVPASPAPPASITPLASIASPAPAPAASPAGDFFGEAAASPADDFFSGTASAPMSAVPPPPEDLFRSADPSDAPPPVSPLTSVPPVTPPRASSGNRAARRPLPSLAVLALGALSLACLTLLAALVMSASDASPAVASSADAVEVAPDPEVAEPVEPAVTGSAGDAVEGSSLSAAQLSQLEAAANLPLTGELTAFLAAAEASFGATSAQLDPALRPYAYRLASRFEWNPDTFRVSVAAPDAALAQSRVDVLTQVFADAVASGRLVFVPATGPSALSLVAA